ncbi:MAG TPA: hypothetical protein PLU44_16920 [Candidatus Krumholzibacteria bacterium]|nr:hypothetical protein [Candidatus Krumholzibacteria bacterium]
MTFLKHCLVLGIVFSVALAASVAVSQAIDMNMTETAPIGTTDGWFLLPSYADAVLVCFPEGEGTVSLWTVAADDEWTRVRPLDERTDGITGATYPASPDSTTPVLAEDCFWWPAAGRVKLIYYKRVEATRVLAYWQEAKIQ